MSLSSSQAQLEDYFEHEFPTARVVGLRLSNISSHEYLLKQCVHGLASAAIALWPDWYGADVIAGLKAVIASNDISPLWREKAEALVSVNHLPLPTGYPNAVHVAQLALALKSSELIISIAVTDLNLTLTSLKSLVAVSTWIAEQTHAKVALLVPNDVLLSEEFDRVRKEIILQIGDASLAKPIEEDIPNVTITSIKGRPNPTSPGEVILAERLGKDAELKGLFSFNQLVKSVHDKEYKVDLVWPKGNLVVEVDGYTFHSDSFTFGQDRHRDYELLISGYRVLRLTHEEIKKDSVRAIAKIRDAVHFIRKNLHHDA